MKNFLCIFLFFVTFSLPALAEEGNEYDNIKDEYIEEAQQFFNTCGSDYLLKQYYDCECLAVRFLDMRIKSGPDKPQDSIMLAIRGTCHDATIAAGEMYSSCMTSGTIFPVGQEPEAYCECLGRTYAKLFEQSGLSPSSKTYKYLKTKAHRLCRQQKN